MPAVLDGALADGGRNRGARVRSRSLRRGGAARAGGDEADAAAEVVADVVGDVITNEDIPGFIASAATNTKVLDAGFVFESAAAPAPAAPAAATAVQAPNTGSPVLLGRNDAAHQQYWLLAAALLLVTLRAASVATGAARSGRHD